MLQHFANLTRAALDLLFPLECLGCGRGGQLICPVCVAELPRLTPPFCRLCSQPGSSFCPSCRGSPPAIDGIRAPYMFQGVIREAVHALKYRNIRAIAPELGTLLAGYLTTNPIPAEVIVPVPLHPRRRRSRGYNQSALLARELSKLTGLPVDEMGLKRMRNSKRQVDMANRQERRRNVADSFAGAGRLAGRAVLLLDDVTTTGSTLFAGAAALKDAGAASVWGLALAKEG